MMRDQPNKKEQAGKLTTTVYSKTQSVCKSNSLIDHASEKGTF